MKTIIIGAAGLLLSTSALAGISQTKTDGAKTMPAASAVQAKSAFGLDEGMIHNAMTIDWASKDSFAAAPVSESKAMAGPKAMQATPDKPMESAEAPAAGNVAKPEAGEATAETPAAPDAGDSAAKPSAGIGGPVETAFVPDTSAQTAVRNYPACSPGPGDDNCIQLYEPGVRAALASWSGTTDGVDDGRTGMGGPEEEMDETSAVGTGTEQAAYEPLPEDAVMPAPKNAELTDAPTRSGTLAI